MRAFEEVGGVDLILLIGFMRIVSARLINAYPNRILNVHPSLLPEVRRVNFTSLLAQYLQFAGGMDMKVHETVLAAGRSESVRQSLC